MPKFFFTIMLGATVWLVGCADVQEPGHDDMADSKANKANAADTDRLVVVDNLGAHQPGTAIITLTAQDEGLSVTLNSPVRSVVGGGIETGRDSQHTSLDQIITDLEQKHDLFLLSPRAECAQENVIVRQAVVESAAGEYTHADRSNLLVEWEHNCSNMQRLASIDFAPLFTLLKGVDTLQIESKLSTGESFSVLTPADNVLRLR